MKVLVLGSGAKDHAIAWMFWKSRRITGLYIAPGNAGTELLGTNLPDVDLTDPEAVLAACRTYHIDYVFAGTEAPLAAGVPDYLRAAGIATFGASSRAMLLEGDRVFARAFTERNAIPTSSYHIFNNLSDMSDFLRANPNVRYVIKRSELAPSRIMIDSADPDRLLSFGAKHIPKGPIIMEEHLKGMAITLTILTDEKGYLLLPVCSDYFKAEDDDKGAPTGGMGSICPVPILTDESYKDIIDTIVEPTFRGMQSEQLSYKGVLIFSLILTVNGPRLVDFHVRFNDPATQAIFPLIKSDLLDITQAIQNQTLSDFKLDVTDESSVAVVVASKGYPEAPETGKTLCKLPYFAKNTIVHDQTILFYGAVERSDDDILTSGGRCFTIVGLGTNILEANTEAYNHITGIRFEGAWYRHDIGNKFFEE